MIPVAGRALRCIELSAIKTYTQGVRDEHIHEIQKNIQEIRFESKEI